MYYEKQHQRFLKYRGNTVLAKHYSSLLAQVNGIVPLGTFQRIRPVLASTARITSISGFMSSSLERTVPMDRPRELAIVR